MQNKKCGLYIRVSTERQAKVEEGSLKNQEQTLQQYIKMKSGISGEEWVIADKYIDRGKSAKDTNRPEYKRMMHDVKEGRINTVLCMALSRISRSTRDLLDMVDYFNRQKIDFICLKEQFDTTTSQGKCVLTIMGALNQFEREQTSERTSSNMLARAQRGLWNGGFILGYDLDTNKKGYLTPNKQEAQIVNFIFDTYFEKGSVLDTARIANEHGYRTKEYISRRNKNHLPKKFCYSSVLNVLTNQTYVGIREINKKSKNKPQKTLPEEKRYITCEAVWKPIVDRSKFNKIQQLLKDNLKHKNNGATPKKHSYLFNGGLLSCHKCGSRMEGRSAHGSSGKKYYYYYCVSPECKHRVAEGELEAAFQKIIGNIASAPHMLQKIADKLNDRFREQVPYLMRQRVETDNQLNQLRSKVSRIVDRLADVDYGKELVEDRLLELGNNKKVLSDRAHLLKGEIESLEKRSVDTATVRKLLKVLDRVFEVAVKPYQKKMLLNGVLACMRICNKELKLGIDASKFKSDITRILRYNVVQDIDSGSQSS